MKDKHKISNGVKILVAVAVLVVFGIFQETRAAEDFSIILSPQNPGANTMVSARISSYHFDVDRSEITWEIDKKIVLKGVGEKNFRFTTPDINKTMRLTVYILTDKGTAAEKTLFFSGNDIDFLWEALTSTPIGYKAKALPVIQSKIKITAIPYLSSLEGKIIPSSELVYEWFLKNKKNISASGTGKNFFIIQLKDFDDCPITLRVSNFDKTIVFEKGIILSANMAEPKILFYETRPLEGPQYNKALQKIQLENNEIAVRAEPYFFSIDNLKQLSYEWLMNREKIFSDELPNTLSLRTPEGSGTSIIDLTITNPVNFMQSAKNSLEISFGL